MKKCRICQIEKPYSDFYKHPNCLDGYNTKCKLCVHVYETTQRPRTQRHVARQKQTNIFKWDNSIVTI